eukprot:SAG31_NODE_3672_length_4001_cov_3.839313_5_plen_92_part_00
MFAALRKLSPRRRIVWCGSVTFDCGAYPSNSVLSCNARDGFAFIITISTLQLIRIQTDGRRTSTHDQLMERAEQTQKATTTSITRVQLTLC